MASLESKQIKNLKYTMRFSSLNFAMWQLQTHLVNQHVLSEYFTISLIHYYVEKSKMIELIFFSETSIYLKNEKILDN